MVYFTFWEYLCNVQNASVNFLTCDLESTSHVGWMFDFVNSHGYEPEEPPPYNWHAFGAISHCCPALVTYTTSQVHKGKRRGKLVDLS